MKRRNLHPNSPEVVDAVIARLKAMSPDELVALLRRRPEGIEETDMTGELARASELRETPRKRTSRAPKPRVAKTVARPAA